MTTELWLIIAITAICGGGAFLLNALGNRPSNRAPDA